MPVNRKRLAIRILSGICFMAVGGLLAGCDTETGKADKLVAEDIAQAEANPGQASSWLTKAAGVADASHYSRAIAKQMLAQSEVASAQALLPDIDQTDAQIQQLAWEIDQLGGQIQANNAQAAALAKHEPVQSVAALNQMQADIKGSADKPMWITGDSAQVPSLAGVNGKIDQLQTQIGQLQDQVKQQTDQRTQLLAESDKLDEQSGAENGAKSVADYNQASDLRKQAAEISVQTDNANAALARLQADLAVSQGQQAVLQEASDEAAARIQKLQSAWDETQKQIQATGQLSQALLGSADQAADSADQTNITAKARKIAELLKANGDRVQEASLALSSAVTHMGEAASAARQVFSDLQQKTRNPDYSSFPQATAARMGTLGGAWVQMSELFNPPNFFIQQAQTQTQLAQLLARQARTEAAVAKTAERLGPILAEAKLQAPSEISDMAAVKYADDFNAADEAFKAADDLLSQATEGTASEERKNAAHLARIYTLYGWSLLSADEGNQEQASGHLHDAMSERDTVRDAGLNMPGLPQALMVAPAAPPAAPGAGATTPAGLKKPNHC